MIPILYETTETSFTSNGIGRLSDAVSVSVEEVRNGIFEMTMTYPITGIHYDEIIEGRYIATTHDEVGDVQPFKIYRISKPIGGICEISAHHLSYAASDIIVRPITASSVSSAFAMIEANCMNTNPFTFWTDNVSAGTLDIAEPRSIRQVLGGVRGSILDVFGGEYEFDKWTIKNHAARGADNGVTIRYGKNLTNLTQEIDGNGLYNSIVPYWISTEGTVVYGGIVSAQGVTNVVARAVDYSQDFQDEPTVAQLTAAAQADLEEKTPWLPSENITIDFVALWQTEEFKSIAPLERVRLCDTVTVIYTDLGVQATAKVIRVVWDGLNERYTEIELGQARSSFASTILGEAMSETEAITKNLASKGEVSAAMEVATEMITGGLGGNIVLTLDGNGKPIEILIMDTADKNTAVNVWRWNMGGLGHSHSGYNGPFNDIAITQDGKINAAQILTGYLVADRIKGGTLTLGGQNNGNGVLQVLDSSGNVIGTWDNSGINASGDFAMVSRGVRTAIGQTTAGPGLLIGWGTNDTPVEWGSRYLQLHPDGYLILSKYSNSTSRIEGTLLYARVFDNSHTTATGFNIDVVTDGFEIYAMQGQGSGGGGSLGGSLRVHKDYFRWNNFYGGSEYPRAYISNEFVQFLSAQNLGIDFRGTRYQRVNGTQIAFASSSSRRYKHDITDLTDDELKAERLYDLPVRQGVYNDGIPLQYWDLAGKTIPMFIAEEVEEIYPSAVIRDAEKKQIESWDERRIIPPMLKLIQDQKKKIDELETRLAALEKLIGGLAIE